MKNGVLKVGFEGFKITWVVSNISIKYELSCSAVPATDR